jgi:hypothetical protein
VRVVTTSGRFTFDERTRLAAIGPFIAKPYLFSTVLDAIRQELERASGN